MDLHWQSLSSVLCCRRCWMTRHRSGPPCRASARSWRKCRRCATPQRSRNSWSKPITRWPTCKTGSLLLCLSWSTLQLWVSTDVVIFLLTCLSLPNYLFLLQLLVFCKYWWNFCFLGGGSHREWGQADGEWRDWDQDLVIVSRDFTQPQRRRPQGETEE